MTSSPCQSSGYRSEANRSLPEVLRERVRTALDVGCVADRNTRALHEAMQRVAGNTVSRAEAADVERDAIELKPESFDLLLLWQVVEHLAGPTATLTRLARYLVPGGWAAIPLRNMAFWRVRLRLLRRDWRRDEAGGDHTHLQFWSSDTAPELLSGTPLTLLYDGPVHW